MQYCLTIFREVSFIEWSFYKIFYSIFHIRFWSQNLDHVRFRILSAVRKFSVYVSDCLTHFLFVFFSMQSPYHSFGKYHKYPWKKSFIQTYSYFILSILELCYALVRTIHVMLLIIHILITIIFWLLYVWTHFWWYREINLIEISICVD